MDDTECLFSPTDAPEDLLVTGKEAVVVFTTPVPIKLWSWGVLWSQLAMSEPVEFLHVQIAARNHGLTVRYGHDHGTEGAEAYFWKNNNRTARPESLPESIGC